MGGVDVGGGKQGPSSFGLGFVHSEAFSALFQEGMELVEEAAAYLDGSGREESAGLDHQHALAYANESMQLTSRLMQIASWLLVQRALADGSLTQQEAIHERGRMRPLLPMATPTAVFDGLPQGFREIVGLAARLYIRLQHLEDLLLEADGFLPESGNPVAEQRWLIEQAFSTVS